jgi:hypothetical protein
MLEFATLAYGLLAMFVLASIERNHREERTSPQIVTLVGWGLCSMSATLSVLLMGLAVILVLGGGVDITSLAA